MKIKNKQMLGFVAALLLACPAVHARRATMRVEVTNSSKMPRTDEPVVFNLKDIGEVKRAVVTLNGKEIPSQLDDLDGDCVYDELCFLTDVGAHETKNYRVELFGDGEQKTFPARTFAELVLPSKDKKLPKNKQDIYLRSITFDARTKDTYHYVHSHGVCFESELIALRVYFDHRQTIDLYGKNHKGLELEATQFYPTDEQKAQGFGDDVLWVGNTYGLGALRGWDGHAQQLLTDVKMRTQRVVAEGPLRAIVEVEDKGWVPAKGLMPVNVVIRYTVYAGHRDFDVQARFSRTPVDFPTYRFATGLINVKGSEEFGCENVRGCWGSDWPTGKDDGQHKLETVGLGIYVPGEYLVSEEKATKDDYTNVVKPVDGVINYKLAYTSANENFGFKDKEAWFAWLRNWSRRQAEPLKVSFKRETK